MSYCDCQPSSKRNVTPPVEKIFCPDTCPFVVLEAEESVLVAGGTTGGGGAISVVDAVVACPVCPASKPADGSVDDEDADVAVVFVTSMPSVVGFTDTASVGEDVIAAYVPVFGTP